MKTDAFVDEQNRHEFQREPANVSFTFELALHTAKPKTDDQTSEEVRLNGYGRVIVARVSSVWSVKNRRVSNVQVIRFPTIIDGKGFAKYLSIGIGGKIRRLIELAEPIELKANRRVEFDVGSIEIIDKVDA